MDARFHVNFISASKVYLYEANVYAVFPGQNVLHITLRYWFLQHDCNSQKKKPNFVAL